MGFNYYFFIKNKDLEFLKLQEIDIPDDNFNLSNRYLTFHFYIFVHLYQTQKSELSEKPFLVFSSLLIH